MYNSTLGHCQKCPMGFYKGDSDMECMSCGEGRTTINEGETSEDRCVGKSTFSSLLVSTPFKVCCVVNFVLFGYFFFDRVFTDRPTDSSSLTQQSG